MKTSLYKYNKRVLISVEELSKYWKVAPSRILHVGAHLAEEADEYVRSGWGTEMTIWIEAQDDLALIISNNLVSANNMVIQCLAWSEDEKEIDFFLSNNSQASSAFDQGEIVRLYPHITFPKKIKLKTKRLDSVLPNGFFPELINLDIQGSELEALKGLGHLIGMVKWIYTEVNKVEIYKDCATIGELDDFLIKHNFKRIATKWYLKDNWGDALYVNTSHVNFKKFDLLKARVLTKFLPMFKQRLSFMKQKILTGIRQVV